MANPPAERAVSLSIVDRLIDTSPQAAADPPVTWGESVGQLKASVLRDLEWLLNTRRILEAAPDQYPELQRSVYHFGLSDISSMSSDSDMVRHWLPQHIEEVIRIFEPRLSNVRVSLGEGGRNQRQVRFVVDALLQLDPHPERLIFDTVLETASGEFSVRSVSDA